jgi:hypothetical protein
MTENYILSYIPDRIRTLGYKHYHLRYRDLMLSPLEQIEVASYNQLWYIVDDPPGMVISSDYGIYDSTGVYLKDHAHEHRGLIHIENPNTDSRRIKFIQVIIIS